MIFGFGLIAGGYAIFYWGLHHFCNVDCIKNQQNPNGCCDNRVSLLTALGVPTKWDIQAGPAVQLNPMQTGNSQNQNQPGSPGTNPNQQTQPQQPSNNATPSPIKNPTTTPGVVQPSQIPGVPHQVQVVPGAPPGGGSAGGVIPLGSIASPNPPSVVMPNVGLGQDFLNWFNGAFNNPTSPINPVIKGMKNVWHEFWSIF